eukprot:TRINITY_DN28088_c0_g1_i1.p1 TRINITY_DN28088_c0_g1~~TRINITY_DN28088_c0_g1_i1.p1  ORF type:complete len:202 (+),score=58.57 TRINITY_DN28088_c0_g1_i1:48-608(+)
MPAAAAPQYEFTEEQNRVWRSLEFPMSLCAKLFALLFYIELTGVYYHLLVEDIGPLAGRVADALDWAFFTCFLYWGQKRIHAVFTTEGNDIDNLMEATTALALLFKKMAFVVGTTVGKKIMKLFPKEKVLPFIIPLLPFELGAQPHEPMPLDAKLALLLIEFLVLTAVGVFGIFRSASKLEKMKTS